MSSRWQRAKKGATGWQFNLGEEFFILDSVIPRVFPDLDVEQFCCASDYSGDQNRSDFLTSSFLYFDPNDGEKWLNGMREIRRISLGPFRTMSYKALGDNKKKQALYPFLTLADSLNGMLVSFAVHKKVSDFALSPHDFEYLSVHLLPNSKWKRRILQKALRTVTEFCFIVGGLLKYDIPVTWLTDNDDFVANESRIRDLYRLALVSLCSITDKKPSPLIIQSSDNCSLDNLLAEDLLSIPDLAAGALAPVLTAHYRSQGVPQLGKEFEVGNFFRQNRSHAELWDWHTKYSDRLKKMIIIFYPFDDPENKTTIRWIPAYHDSAPSYSTLENHREFIAISKLKRRKGISVEI